MSRPVQNHLDSYKMYNQILQFSDQYLYQLKKFSQNFHPPGPPQKVLQTHFQVILSDLSLDAPVRPWMPLCQNAICLTSPGAGACHPKRVVHLSMYRSFGHKLIVRYIFYNFRRVTTYIFIIINIVHMILTFKGSVWSKDFFFRISIFC